MRTWRRASVQTICGQCGRHVVKGEPVLEITLTGLRHKTRRYRCSRWICAEEPVPLDLPPIVERTPIPMTPMLLVPVGAGRLPLDWKAIGAGDRDPGEDD